MIRVGMVGATGYGGRELLRLLVNHPDAELVAASSTSAVGQEIGAFLPGFKGLTSVEFEEFDANSLAKQCDVVFIGVPGTESMDTVASLRAAGVSVIDMGPDFRLLNLDDFKQYYKTDHTQPKLLAERVYGIVPLYREALRKADLVAVPGCYPLSVIIPLKPLVSAMTTDIPIVVDSISGISGAGKSLNQQFHFPEMNENVLAYKLGVHQHTPEMEQELDHKVQIQFSPHVGPFTRGILSTITVRPNEDLDLNSIFSVYDDEPFVRVLGEGTIPNLNHVHGTNFCDFGWVKDERTGNLIIVSTIDNLVGGTAGMAVQCMNLMFSIEETTGLRLGGMTI
jgi:N-acetyl-gamma-glutamyl-phosphate reductase